MSTLEVVETIDDSFDELTFGISVRVVSTLSIDPTCDMVYDACCYVSRNARVLWPLSVIEFLGVVIELFRREKKRKSAKFTRVVHTLPRAFQKINTPRKVREIHFPSACVRRALILSCTLSTQHVTNPSIKCRPSPTSTSP